MAANNANTISGDDWAGEQGDKWLANIDSFEGMIAPIGEALIAAAAPRPGEAALDIGSGGGMTTIALARATAPTGTATGLDISAPLSMEMLKRAAKAGVSNVSAIIGDAGKVQLQRHAYDILFSRFGVMFFADPVAAFRHLHSSLKPDGRVHFACWASPKENEWVSAVIETISRHIDLPTPEPRAPGPFAFADPGYVEEILQKAGYKNVGIAPWKGVHSFAGKGATPQSAAQFALKAMSVGKTAHAAPAETQAAIRRDLVAAFEKMATPEGIPVRASCWFVSARP